MVARTAAKFDIVANDRASKQINAVQGGFSNLARSATVLDGPLNGISGRLTAVSSGLAAMNPLLLAGGVGAAAFTAGLFKSLAAAGEFESQMLRVEALLRSTGNSSGRTARQIDDLALSIGEGTLASASGVRDAAGVLLTFQTISGETFNRTLRVSQDLAAVMGTDLKSAVLQLGKALEDPERGLTALRRSGISFTESQREMIVAMSAAGKELEAQDAILGRIEEQVGGAGAAEAGGLRGSVDSLSESWEQLLIAVGSSSAIMAPVIATLGAIKSAVDVLRGVTEDAPQLDNLKEQVAIREQIQRIENESAAGLPLSAARLAELRELESALRSLENQHAALIQSRKLEEAAATRAGEASRASRAAETEGTKRASQAVMVHKILLGQEDDIRAKLEKDIKAENDAREEQRRAVDRIIGPLVNQRNELGLNSEELVLYRLGLVDAIDTQKEMAVQIQRTIDVFEVAENITGDLEDAFVSMGTGVEVSIKDMVISVLADIERMIFRLLVVKPLLDSIKESLVANEKTGGILGGILGGSALSGFGSALGSIFSGGVSTAPTIPRRAAGGPVSANMPVLVGEQGPEILVPGSAGTVVPNSALGGPVAITFNIDATDARGFDQLLVERRSMIIGMVESALNRQGRPGLSR